MRSARGIVSPTQAVNLIERGRENELAEQGKEEKEKGKKNGS